MLDPICTLMPPSWLKEASVWYIESILNIPLEWVIVEDGIFGVISRLLFIELFDGFETSIEKLPTITPEYPNHQEGSPFGLSSDGVCAPTKNHPFPPVWWIRQVLVMVQFPNVPLVAFTSPRIVALFATNSPVFPLRISLPFGDFIFKSLQTNPATDALSV